MSFIEILLFFIFIVSNALQKMTRLRMSFILDETFQGAINEIYFYYRATYYFARLA